MLKRFISIAMVLAAAVAAHAQGDFLRRPSPFAGRTLLTLALFDEVQAELKLSADENTKINGLTEKLSGEMQDAFQSANGDFAAVRAAIEKIDAKYDDQLLTVLTSDQDSRLKQLYVQFNHGSSISNPIFQKDLGITEEQKTKIKTLQDDAYKNMFDGGGPPDPDTMKKKQADLATALLAVLTPDQKAKFDGMQGAKFAFKVD